MNLGLGRNSRLEELVSVRTVNVGLFCLGGISLIWLIVSLSSENTALMTAITLFAFVAVLLGFALQLNGNTGASRWVLIIAATAYWSGIMLTMGPMSGTEYFLAALLALPVLVFSRGQITQMVLAVLMIGAVFALVVSLSQAIPPSIVLPKTYFAIAYQMNALFLAVMIFAAVTYYRGFAASSYQELVSRKQQNDALVSTIFPKDIARRLEEGETSIADWHQDATVMYASITGFSQLYNRMPATELVNRLASIYAEFDHLCQHYQIDKVKTLGMTYVAATGIAGRASDHRALAACALAMQRAVVEFAQRTQLPVAFRCGLATGLAISGVTAEVRPRFDLWGEALESAGQMSALADAGSICVNETAYWRLRDVFVLEAIECRDASDDERMYRLLREIKTDG
jgi:class 3 adenylate cyclase